MTQYIGTATSRIDGIAKVTGAAKYAADFNAPGLLYSWVVGATIAKGRITSIDRSAAMRVKGVVDVLAHDNRPQMPDNDEAYHDDVAPEGSPFRPLYDDKIMFNGQPIALVVAETSEAARYAASLVKVEYAQEAHVTDVFKERDAATPIKIPSDPGAAAFAPQKPRGNADQALAAAAVRQEAEYYVPSEYHNPMELYASTAIYEAGGKLTVYDKTQGVQNVQRYLCGVFGLKPDDVRVMGAFMGGGFGSGLRPQFQVLLAVLAARALKRSVRVMLTRPQMYALGYRPAMIQKVALGANAGGTLDVIAHDAVTTTSQYEDFYRQETGWSGLLYKSANAKYAHKLAHLDMATSCDMRAPSATTALFALESAMDELAIRLRLDPVELRLRCYSDRDQHENKPFSSKALRECYRQGAEAFGWSKRNPEPRSMREGKDLVGWGMATGVWEALQVPITVRIALGANGHAEVACATSDIGTGTYTIMAQVAADMLGLPLDSISIKLGDSSLPQSPVEGGSWIAASVSNGIATTAGAIRDELLRLAQKIPNSPLANAAPDDVTLADGKLVSKRDASRSVSIADAMRQGGVDRIEQEKTTNPTQDQAKAHNTHSAIFIEVKVDEEIGVVRVTRAVSAVAGGRILNTKTATSQILGGVVWGIGMALHEAVVIDHKFGRIMNANIAEYVVPVHADIHDIKVIFVDEPEDSNPLGIKGLGEIGIVGVAAAVANAVYHATGKRVRDLPITLDKVTA
ncbi:xanthine dehydrogenase family protein molybdopterin-binding subunit [Rhodoplanes sp. Z2-YC6860]|uniref:xanthine dehydrogenase family protein molybdopterin-binding subunit n=1 Tax=Rhodoplanes sp. Z2-YC6860 TaxID=674703 RepID=UPI00078E9C2F|nr:xanthine dehydrogenase family protein molybdopterin-binding subunit [Rhodoplanes sp. Z2-YC6860]AMN40693.1 aldehyde oxidase and xanthine dehydrogenase, molybdopterin binding [Rhodoplanes sp. Z2-YC6860]